MGNSNRQYMIMESVVVVLIAMMAIYGCKAPTYELAYVTDRDNVLDICIANSENNEVQNLTDSDVVEYNLTWSADGHEIYYTSYDKNNRSIKKVNVNSKAISVVINDSTVLSLSDVSDDNGKLIISTREHHPKGELYLYDIHTGDKTRLTNNELYEAGAKFSPDERHIVASIQTQASDSINHSGIAEIFIIEVSTLKNVQLTDLKKFSALPDYAPNGTTIAFHKCDEGICDIYTINQDGTELKNLTNGDNDNRWPRWSPDGKWIAFTKTINDNSDIYLISWDGKTIKPLVATEFRDEIAIFKPN